MAGNGRGTECMLRMMRISGLVSSGLAFASAVVFLLLGYWRNAGIALAVAVASGGIAYVWRLLDQE